MVGDCDSPEVRPHLEDQGGRSCLGIPEMKRKKKNRAVIQMTLDSTDEELSAQSSFYSQSLLSVQDVQAVRLFLQVPEKNIQNTNEVHRKALWVGRVSLQTKIN